MRMDIETHEMLSLLAKAREAHPELRIGQLIENAAAMGACGVDVFYVTDDALAEGLKTMADMPRGSAGV